MKQSKGKGLFFSFDYHLFTILDIYTFPRWYADTTAIQIVDNSGLRSVGIDNADAIDNVFSLGKNGLQGDDVIWHGEGQL